MCVSVLVGGWVGVGVGVYVCGHSFMPIPI